MKTLVPEQELNYYWSSLTSITQEWNKTAEEDLTVSMVIGLYGDKEKTQCNILESASNMMPRGKGSNPQISYGRD